MAQAMLENPIDLDRAEVLDVSRRGDGRQRVLKVVHHGRLMVLKCYGLKRSSWRVAARLIGSHLLVHKSSVRVAARRETELEVLRLWKREHFDVPEVCPLPPLPADAPPCIAMEWIPALPATRVLEDPTRTLDEKKEIVTRFGRAWARRHARALELNEPRLLLENPTLDHVFVSLDRLVHFDFEIVFTRKNDLERLVRREIVGILWSLAKSTGDAFPVLLDVLLDAYRDHALVERTVLELKRYGGVPVLRWTAWFHRLTRWRERYASRAGFTRALESGLCSGSNGTANRSVGRCS